MFLALFAHLFLRLFLAGTLYYLGWRHLGPDRAALARATTLPLPIISPIAGVWLLGLTELVLATLLTAGAYTQIAALLAATLALKMLIFRKCFAHATIPQPLFWVLVLGASLSLFITGAGALAVDLPF